MPELKQPAPQEENLPNDPTDWEPGTAIKGRTYTRAAVYSNAEGAKGTVGTGENKRTYPLISLVPDHTARYLGMKQINWAEIPEGANYRGSKGAGSIKIPWMVSGKPKRSAKGNIHLVSIPVPAWARHSHIVAFLKAEAAQNKPPFYVSRHGVTRYTGLT